MGAKGRLIGHQVSILWRGERIVTLGDLIPEAPRVVFVGYNPRPESVNAGHYYQGHGGRTFWTLLQASGLIPTPAGGDFHDDVALARGFGFTDIVKRCGLHPPDDEEEYTYGGKRLRRLLFKSRPQVISSVYKGALARLTGLDLTNRWGLLDETFGESRLFVLPFPYRSAKDISLHMRQLRALLTRSRQ